jgi:putative DNA primase/helicase
MSEFENGKADIPTVVPGEPPAELRALPQWVVWAWVERKGKRTKPPIDPNTGKPTDATNRAAWMPYDKALELAPAYAGIGFAVTEADPFVGVDLDHAIGEDGAIAPWARAIVDRLQSYTEITPSTRGLRIWIRGVLPYDANGKTQHKRGGFGADGDGAIEFYDRKRYFTVTGQRIGDWTTIEDRDRELKELHGEIFHAKKQGNPATSPKASERKSARNQVTPPTTVGAHETDEQIIRRAREAANGAKFAALFDGDISGHGGITAGRTWLSAASLLSGSVVTPRRLTGSSACPGSSGRSGNGRITERPQFPRRSRAEQNSQHTRARSTEALTPR